VDETPTEKNQMNKMIMSALAILASTTFAFAADDSSLTTKAMKDQPGTMGGSTANPTAVPDTGAATQKAMKDQPGTMGGSTDMPTAKSDGGSLSEKAMKDQPGTK
jgi:inosine/xanthosine triphosphate pyrophosphatase family protein